jgi:hypothetical protein
MTGTAEGRTVGNAAPDDNAPVEMMPVQGNMERSGYARCARRSVAGA